MKTKRTLFISAPISTSWSTVGKFIEHASGMFSEVVWWERNTPYSQRTFDNAGAVLFILPNNEFEATFSELPIGLKSELANAYAQDKHIYVGYMPSSTGRKPAIYQCKTDGKSIRGISGTAGSLYVEEDAIMYDHEFTFDEDNGFVTTKAREQRATARKEKEILETRLLLLC